MNRKNPLVPAWLYVLAATALVGSEVPAQERPAPSAQTYEIPYKLTPTNHIMVRLKLNGKGPFNFIVDTGAPAIFCAVKVAKKAGVEPNREGWGTIEMLEVEGGLKVSHVSARIEDPFQLEGMNSLGIAGVELHGMVGYNFLAKYRITYDFASDKLLLTELPGFEPQEVPTFGRGGQGGLEAIGMIMKLIAPLMNFKGPPERLPRGYFGIEYADRDGVVVTAVYPDSPAEKAGLRVGDLITGFNSRKIENKAQFLQMMAKQAVQDTVELTIKRNGEKLSIKVQLGRGA